MVRSDTSSTKLGRIPTVYGALRKVNLTPATLDMDRVERDFGIVRPSRTIDWAITLVVWELHEKSVVSRGTAGSFPVL